MALARAARALLALLALALFSGEASASRTSVTPVQQVLQMLQGMQVKGEKAAETERKVYAEYKEWADERTTELGFEIETSKNKIEELTAFIQKASSKAALLGRAIAGLGREVERMEAEKEDAVTTRREEHSEYVKIQKDLSESVDALEGASARLAAEAYDRPGAKALLQGLARSKPGLARALAAFVQGGQPGAPAVAAYEFQSGGIVQVLEGLQTKFRDQLQEVETAEANRQHYFDLEVLHLTDSSAKATQEKQEKATIKAKTMAESAKAAAELAEARKDLAADEELRAGVAATFEAKTAAFVKNQQVRKDELAALHKAVQIISSPDVAESYHEHVNAPAAATEELSLLQASSSSSRSRALARGRAAGLLRSRARTLSSEVLESVAAQVDANPFAKVIRMIEGLLERLKEQAGAEADHKAWCDGQLKANKHKRDKKGAEAEQLAAAGEGLGARIETMGETLNTLSREQVELTKAMASATKLRQEEKAENTEAITDAQAGHVAVQRALVVLRQFYAAQASSLVQVSDEQAPEMAEYAGMRGGSKGVVGMLEVIQSDFLRLETETKAAEEQAAREYAKFMSDAKADTLQKHKSEVKLRLARDQAEFEKEQVAKDLAATEAALAKANEYYGYLKPNCLKVHVSYAARVARRKEEIEALKEAYGILDGK